MGGLSDSAPGATAVSLARTGLMAALLVAAAIATLMALSSPARAQQSLTVDTTADENDAASDCEDGDPSTTCSLREAVMAANADLTQAAEITLTANTYDLSISGTSGDASNGDLVVTSDVTVQGAGVDATTIDASGLGHRVFRVPSDREVPVSLTLEDVTVTGGDLTESDAPGQRGGGVYATNQTGGPTVTVEVLRSRIVENAAQRGGGLALDAVEGDVQAGVTRSAITGNTGSGGGGGVYAAGLGGFSPTASIHRSVIDNNSVGDGAGGGVLNEGGELELVNTTVSNNTASFAGGIHNDNGPQDLPVGVMRLTHVTVARNEVSGTAVTSHAIANPAESMTARATIVAENPDAASTQLNCADALTTLGHNLEDENSCGFGDSTDQPSTAPGLADLAQNAPEDPPTRTHALPASSPAVDDVPAGDCDVGEDQRKVSRPQDGDGDGSSGCDVGAFELQGEPEEPEADVVVDKSAPGSATVGDEFDYEVTVSNAGPDVASDVELVDTLPGEVSFVSASASSGSCSETSPGTVECPLGDIASGDSVTVTITVSADAATSAATNTGEATTTTTDPNPGNNADQTDTLISEDDFQCTPDNTEDPLPQGVSRLSGPERIATAIRISQESCPDGAADVVVLTRADIYPDALSGTPLATQEDAPILFSQTDQLTAATAGELQRVLSPGGTVYLLGQTAALSNQVEADVDALGFNTVRIGGANRFGTAAKIADQGLGNPDTLLITDGANFPDAITGASGEAVNGAVLLTADNVMPGETQSYLAGRTDNPDLFAIGGPAASAAPSATPVVGATRFDTSVQVATQFFSNPSAVGIATGGQFADALAGGALMGKLGGPMLLTGQNTLPPVVETYLENNATNIDRAIIFGGTAVVSSSVESQIDTAITP